MARFIHEPGTKHMAPLAVRRERLMPGGVLKYVRCYLDDNTQLFTVVFSGRYTPNTNGEHVTVTFRAGNPYAPGNAKLVWSKQHPDRPNYGHLGRKARQYQLTEAQQRYVLEVYEKIWCLQ